MAKTKVNMFRLTYWMTIEDLSECYAWLAPRGVPVAIVKETRHGDMEVYSVWRGPWRAMKQGSLIVSKPDVWDTYYQIVIEANGFSQGVAARPPLQNT